MFEFQVSFWLGVILMKGSIDQFRNDSPIAGAIDGIAGTLFFLYGIYLAIRGIW